MVAMHGSYKTVKCADCGATRRCYTTVKKKCKCGGKFKVIETVEAGYGN